MGGTTAGQHLAARVLRIEWNEVLELYLKWNVQTALPFPEVTYMVSDAVIYLNTYKVSRIHAIVGYLHLNKKEISTVIAFERWICICCSYYS